MKPLKKCETKYCGLLIPEHRKNCFVHDLFSATFAAVEHMRKERVDKPI
jgi:hypothetical protein